MNRRNKDRAITALLVVVIAVAVVIVGCAQSREKDACDQRGGHMNHYNIVTKMWECDR